MRAIWTIAALPAALVAATASAQSVKAGIEAWQTGDPARAIDIWKPLAEAGDADAAFNLGQAYRLGRGTEINLAKAQDWLERAARAGHADAQSTLGLLLFQNGNRTAGLRWLKQASEQGEPRAMLIYGTALFNGDGVPRDPVLAYALVSRAAAQGLAPARSTLAQMDELIPIEQRRKGVALAKEKASQKPKPPAAAVSAPAPKPVRQAAPDPPAPPKISEARSSPTKAPAQGRWRIQLGAFSKRQSAEQLFARLSNEPSLGGRKPYYVAAGPLTRLQVGPFESRSDAGSACSALKSRGQACFPVESR